MPLEIKRFGVAIHHDILGDYYTILDLELTQPHIDIKELEFRPVYTGDLLNNFVNFLNSQYKLKENK